MEEELKNNDPPSQWIVQYDADIAETLNRFRELGYYVKYSRGLTEVRDKRLETFFILRGFLRV